MSDSDERFLLTLVGLLGAGAIGYLLAKWLIQQPSVTTTAPQDGNGGGETRKPIQTGLEVHVDCDCLLRGDCDGQTQKPAAYQGSGTAAQSFQLPGGPFASILTT